MTSHFFRTCLETQNRPNYWYARRFFGWCSLRQRNWRLNSGLKSATIVTDPLQNSQLLNFTDFMLGYMEVLSCNVWSFLTFLYEIPHNDSEDIIRTHNYGYFASSGQKCSFWTKVVSSLKTSGLYYRNSSYGYIKHSLKIWAWSDNFIGIRSLKFK